MYVCFCSRRNSASNNSSVMSWKVNPYPEPPPAEYVNFKMNEERKLAKIKDLKEKTDAILQRRKYVYKKYSDFIITKLQVTEYIYPCIFLVGNKLDLNTS